MQQRANNVAAISATMENPIPPKGNYPVQIPTITPSVIPPPIINPMTIEIGDQQDALFSPRVSFVYDAFGPPANKVEKKVWAIEEKLNAMKGSNIIGFDAAEMCLVPWHSNTIQIQSPRLWKIKGSEWP